MNWSGAEMRCPKCNKYLPDRCTCNGPSAEERRAAPIAAQLDQDAEPAAFEAWTRKDIGMPDNVPFNWDSHWAKAALEGWLERARRAEPVVAQLDADNLPPLPKGECASFLRMDTIVYTTEQVEQIRRADLAPYAERIRHLEREAGLLKVIADQLKARIEAADTHIERLEAAERRTQQPAQSIGDDETFVARAFHWAGVRDMYEDDEHKSVIAAWAALIAYIDGRTAGTASEAAPDPVVEANRQLLLDRSRVGVKKYGVTLGAAGLAGHHLMQHALEEALDLANYLQTLLQTERVHTVPDDWKPAPQQYTDAQLAAGVAQYKAVVGGAASAESICGVIYDGMIAAAPSTQEGAKP